MDPIHASRLLQCYTASRCGASFRELVEGHAGLVYSTALRITGDTGLAEDVMQTVFVGLAAKPEVVRNGRTLAAWLHRVARGRAVDAVRVETRRRQREQDATQMNAATLPGPSESDSLWEAAAPVIDTALGRLGETDRQLLLLRFWQRQDMRCIGLTGTERRRHPETHGPGAAKTAGHPGAAWHHRHSLRAVRGAHGVGIRSAARRSGGARIRGGSGDTDRRCGQPSNSFSCHDHQNENGSRLCRRMRGHRHVNVSSTGSRARWRRCVCSAPQKRDIRSPCTRHISGDGFRWWMVKRT